MFRLQEVVPSGRGSSPAGGEDRVPEMQSQGEEVNLLPDSIRCQITRVHAGSFEVYPWIADRIPYHWITSKWMRQAVMPIVVLAPWIVAFNAPRSMVLIVPAWIGLAWYIGHCPHCIEQEEDREEPAHHHEDATA